MLGTIGEIKANASNGKLVNKPALQFANPTSSRIIPINGPTDVMPGRKLNAAIIIPITIKAPYVCLAPMAIFFCSKSTHETPFKHIVLDQYTTQTLKDKSCGQIEKTEIYESQVINDTFFRKKTSYVCKCDVIEYE